MIGIQVGESVVGGSRVGEMMGVQVRDVGDGRG